MGINNQENIHRAPHVVHSCILHASDAGKNAFEVWNVGPTRHLDWNNGVSGHMNSWPTRILYSVGLVVICFSVLVWQLQVMSCMPFTYMNTKLDINSSANVTVTNIQKYRGSVETIWNVMVLRPFEMWWCWDPLKCDGVETLWNVTVLRPFEMWQCWDPLKCDSVETLWNVIVLRLKCHSVETLWNVMMLRPFEMW